ncbi:ComEC/Rec2 family competence protein [uncultured Bifidobacterium sp.]|uniref:ComEC/Rec2 family competence protein n=1 Tax=uncultured Bifidobacterium sp. TaxID=165187 RepID=UPI00259AB207|nr:ComEC/Rec2 family competence protein [uncultured Bifidobacterium sp.]
MTGTANAAREQGSRDWRMLPVAVAIWLASLGTHRLFAMLMGTDGGTDRAMAGSGSAGIGSTGAGSAGFGAAAPTLPVVAVLGAGVLIGVALAVVMLRRRRRRAWPGGAALLCCGVLLSANAAWCADLADWHDPVSALARQGAQTVVADVTVTTPALASAMFGADCQADIRVDAVGTDGLAVDSRASARLYASGSGCGRLAHGARLRFSGTLALSEFGPRRIAFTVADGGGGRPLSDPPWWRRAINRMQEAMFAATGGLSDQGRLLVPGLTVGVLGSQWYDRHDDAAEQVDATYAAQLEERFQRSGIMHLMAVSGGHFVLVTGVVRWLCARFLAHRYVVAAASAACAVGLAVLMYPSDSVLRALVMGLFGAAATALGRRSQALSALCWTASAVIVIDPSMSVSFGFALSCAAVLGITTISASVSARLERVLPRGVASAMAITVAATLFTLPVQVLMEPVVPLLSIPANLMVAPVVDAATMAGLGALLVSWCCADIGALLAHVASLGTKVMQVCADWLGGSERMTLPWAGGVGGMALIVAVECALVAMMLGMERLMLRGSVRAGRSEPNGEPLRPWRLWHTAVGLWLAQTPQVFDTWALPREHRR